MRELTATEIEQFDFSGRIPDLKTQGIRRQASASVTAARPKHNLKLRARAKVSQKGRSLQLA
jgi:hypothetical protein